MSIEQMLLTILSKTSSGRLKWSDGEAKVGDASLSFHHEHGRLELEILKRDVARYFAGDLVRELYLEVQRLAVRTEPEFLEDLRKL